MITMPVSTTYLRCSEESTSDVLWAAVICLCQQHQPADIKTTKQQETDWPGSQSTTQHSISLAAARPPGSLSPTCTDLFSSLPLHLLRSVPYPEVQPAGATAPRCRCRPHLAQSLLIFAHLFSVGSCLHSSSTSTTDRPQPLKPRCTLAHTPLLLRLPLGRSIVFHFIPLYVLEFALATRERQVHSLL